VSPTPSVQVVALAIFAVNAVLMASLIVLKVIHRERDRRAGRRRTQYRRTLSRHIAFENCTDPITERMVSDPAFIDALVDLRSALSGETGRSMRGMVDSHGITEHQMARLRASFPVGRRLRAAVILAELGDETAAEVLMEHLDDREPEIRIQAARGLGRMRWTPAIDALVTRFGTETPWVQARFADTLATFGTEATWPLLAYIRINQEFDSKGPAAAIRALGTVGDDQAVAPLVEILKRASDAEVTLAAIETLGTLGNPVAAPVLRNTARSSDWRFRAKSMTALADIGDPLSVDVLGDGLRDPSLWVRRNAAAALVRVRGGIDRLFDALDDDDRFAADAAAEALADAGELAAARQRHDSGEASERDRVLLGHMAGAR
jgi:HEAT repeat protein